MLNFSTGSLGHGLPNSTGLAYALKLKKSKKKVICLLGDQELMEGTTWESLHIIDNYKINNLIIVIDRNNSDFRSIKFIDLKKKLSVFSKNIYHLDGHNLVNIKKLFSKCLSNNKFNIIIANTIKGYGIKSMHDNPEWHHKFPNSEELKRFKEELKI
jgi:transketolase